MPDKDDRHVLAAAIHCQANHLVTYNLKDFPESALEPYQIEAHHPDSFACQLLENSPDLVMSVVEEQRQSLHNPARTAEQMLTDFKARDLNAFAKALRQSL